MLNPHLKKFIKEKFSKSATALDLGMGDKRDVIGLKKINWKVFGVDINSKPSVDLNFPYKNKRKVDLVYSNYVIQFIKNKQVFVNTCFNNLLDCQVLFKLSK